MSEVESGKEETDATAAPSSPASPPGASSLTSSLGEWLRLAREQRGLTTHQVASDLHLDTQIINAIEVNRFKEMGAPVYAKGYLRRYARLVGLSEDEALSKYEVLSDTPRAVDPIPAAHGKMPEPSRNLPAWVRWLVAGVAVLVIVIVVINSVRQSGEDAVAVTQAPPSETASANVPVPPTTARETPLQLADQGALPEATASVTPAAANPVASVAASSVSGTVTMQLRFSDDSWVEVYGANNQTLLYDMGSPTTPRTVTGTPPWRVTLGSASAVQVTINGKARSVPVGKIQTNVAHFNVNAAGEIE